MNTEEGLAIGMAVSAHIVWLALWILALSASTGPLRHQVLLLLKWCAAAVIAFSSFWAAKSFGDLHQGIAGFVPGFVFGLTLGSLFLIASGAVALTIVLVSKTPGPGESEKA